MKRRLFTILSALSLVLCLACAGMWLRTGFVTEFVNKIDGRGRGWYFCSGSSTLLLQLQTHSDETPTSPDAQVLPWNWQVMAAGDWGAEQWTWPGYRTTKPFSLGLGDQPVILRELFLPYWLLTLFAAVLPGFWCWRRWRRWKAKRRHKEGLCRVCGYDLRASPERCPECGTAVPSPKPQDAT